MRHWNYWIGWKGGSPDERRGAGRGIIEDSLLRRICIGGVMDDPEQGRLGRRNRCRHGAHGGRGGTEEAETLFHPLQSCRAPLPERVTIPSGMVFRRFGMRTAASPLRIIEMRKLVQARRK